MTTATALSGTLPLVSPSSGAPPSASLYCSDPMYSPTSTSPTHSLSPSPRLTHGLLGPFLSGQGGALAGLGNGNSALGVGPLGLVSTTQTPTSTSECRMVEVHGVKVASFNVDGQELICLPQVFELFLKNLVGGLHTVYTKLKRLDICPVVCSVEQVRILRGLGAIQPGVNRCKLISRKDFEALYNDCTSASSRPGRPPKRCSGGGIQESPRLFHQGVPGLLSPGFLSHSGLTAAAMAELQKLQKMKMMMMSFQNGHDSDNDDMHSNTGGSECSWDKDRLTSPSSGGGGGRLGLVNHHPHPHHHHHHQQQQQQQQQQHGLNSLQQQQLLANRLDLPFMMMPHPLLPVGLPPASVAMAMSQMNHLNTIANMAAAAQQMQTHSHRAPVIKERVCDSPSPSPNDSHTPPPSQTSSSTSTSPDRFVYFPSISENSSLATPMRKPGADRLASGQAPPPGFPAPFLFADGLSSVENLLTNIQGLLKVAVENARLQDNQIQAEKRELKLELYREREMRENLERRLTSELQSRASIQKRLKKEKKAKRKLQEALEFESKRRERVEDALKHSSSSPSPEPPHNNDRL
ncbi:dachshund b [Aplochiton taeniatus]